MALASLVLADLVLAMLMFANVGLADSAVANVVLGNLTLAISDFACLALAGVAIFVLGYLNQGIGVGEFGKEPGEPEGRLQGNRGWVGGATGNQRIKQ